MCFWVRHPCTLILSFPSYFDIIKNPVNVKTMSTKLEDGRYKDRQAFESDFRLMVQNAWTYNPPGSFVHAESSEFESSFNKRMLFSVLINILRLIIIQSGHA